MKQKSNRWPNQYTLILISLVLSWGCVDSDADSPNLFDYAVGGEVSPFGGELLEEQVGQDHTDLDMMTVDQEVTSFDLPNEVSIATYNVQNLFDFINDADHYEGDFTPNVGQWSRETYEARLRAIASAIKIIDADVVTLQEVESEVVLNELAQEVINQGGRRYDHLAVSSSRDPRGIALGVMSIYPLSREIGRPISSTVMCQSGETLDGSRPEARPIYEINLWSDGSGGGGGGGPQSLTLLVNHWKSRASDDYPCLVREHHQRGAQQINGLLETWISADPQRSIVVLGDFNAVESEASMSSIINAYLNQAELAESSALYNLWGELGVTPSSSNNATNSTYRYRGDWFRLDHILVNYPLTRQGQGVWVISDFELIRAPSFFRNGAPHGWSNQTRQGISDHLPLKVIFKQRSLSIR